MTPAFDVAVLGAGPAGTVVARRLAAAGARVVVVHGTRPAAAREGFSARTRELLLAEGLEEVVATLEGPVPRAGTWGDGRAVAGVEWLADRRRVAAALAAGLDRAGVASADGPATRVDRLEPGFRIHGARGEVSARVLVDARGRRGPQTRGPLLLAAGRSFETRSGAAGASIHAWSRGWCWLADDGERTFVQLASAPRRGVTPEHWFADAAREVPGLARVLASPGRGPLLARAAHARLGRSRPGRSIWTVGDAAVALDPLSGQGVFEALRGGATLAAAVRTELEGGDAAAAVRFVGEACHEAWSKAVGAAARFYGENAARGAFWSETSAAYARLVERVPAAAPRVDRRPVLEDGRIRERPVLVTARAPRGVWHVDGVPVVALLDFLERPGPAAATAVDVARRFGRPPAAAEAALAWLRASGALAPAAASHSSGG